jgi:small subunit ribosomal protein S8
MKYKTRAPQQSPLGDLATRLRNGHLRHRSSVICFASKLGQSVLSALWREGFIYGYRILENGSEVEVFLKYSEGSPVVRKIKLVSMPGRPVYFSVQDLRQFQRRNSFAILVLTTPKGVLSCSEAISQNQGGKVLIEVD